MKEGWQTKTLGEICEFLDRRGVTPEKLGSQFKDNGFRVISAKNIKGRTIDIAIGEQRFVDEPTYMRWMRSPLLVDDVILTSEAPLGEPAYVARELKWCLGQRLFGVRSDKSRLYGRFLFYAFQASPVRDDMLSRATGATAQGIRQSELAKVALPVPPLPEQQRIVALLDEAFEALATAKANAEQNLQNARALFESQLETVFTEHDNTWIDSSIGSEVRFIDYRGKTPIKTSSGVRLITAKNVKMGFLQDTPREFIASTNYEGWMTRGIPRKGDVLFTTEAPLANVAQLDTDEKVAFAQRIIIMQPNRARLDDTFLKYLLLSQSIQQRIRTRGTGATVQGIKASLLKQIEISFPESLTAQEEIVARLDALSAETQRLTRIYERKLAALEELKKALLHQAFNGEL